MNDDFKEIIQKFKKINSQGYIPGINNNLTNSCGLTFEKLIGKNPDTKYLPDFNTVEIKTTQRFSRYEINLFSITFSGPDLYEGIYLLEKYGYKKDNRTVLFTTLRLKRKVLINDKYYFELNIDYNFDCLYINIYDINYNYVETRGFIEFDKIKERLELKLKNLALIYASKKLINDRLHFRYYKIICYKYTNFNTFLKLIESGDIIVTLMLDVRDDINEKNRNKNLVFRIAKTSVHKLFEEIYTYEN